MKLRTVSDVASWLGMCIICWYIAMAIGDYEPMPSFVRFIAFVWLAATFVMWTMRHLIDWIEAKDRLK